MDMATTAVDTAAGAVTITDGKEAAATTNGATIAVGKAFAVFAFVIPLPGRYANAATRTVAPMRRGRFSKPANPSLEKPNLGMLASLESSGAMLQPAFSQAPSPPRSGSGPNDSWRRASA